MYKRQVSKLLKQPDEIGGAETQAPYLVVSDIDAIYALSLIHISSGCARIFTRPQPNIARMKYEALLLATSPSQNGIGHSPNAPSPVATTRKKSYAESPIIEGTKSTRAMHATPFKRLKLHCTPDALITSSEEMLQVVRTKSVAKTEVRESSLDRTSAR